MLVLLTCGCSGEPTPLPSTAGSQVAPAEAVDSGMQGRSAEENSTSDADHLLTKTPVSDGPENADAPSTVRFATFNVALNRKKAGAENGVGFGQFSCGSENRRVDPAHPTGCVVDQRI